MYAYAESYLKEVVETQGKLFEEVAEYEPGIDVKFFIKKYMESKTREYIDHGQAYVCTLDAKALWDYFCKSFYAKVWRCNWRIFRKLDRTVLCVFSMVL